MNQNRDVDLCIQYLPLVELFSSLWYRVDFHIDLYSKFQFLPLHPPDPAHVNPNTFSPIHPAQTPPTITFKPHPNYRTKTSLKYGMISTRQRPSQAVDQTSILGDPGRYSKTPVYKTLNRAPQTLSSTIIYFPIWVSISCDTNVREPGLSPPDNPHEKGLSSRPSRSPAVFSLSKERS